MDQVLQSAGYGQENLEVAVPRSVVGIIIGRSGENIKRLCSESGAKIQFQPDERPDSLERVAVISGTHDQVGHASQLIAACVEKGGSSPSNYAAPAFSRQPFSQCASNLNAESSYEGSSALEVVVPRSSVGIIIGKSGETIKRLSMQTGTKIQFKPDDRPDSTERNAVIYGSPENINYATRLISDLVEKSNASSEAATEIFFLHVPQDKTGLVIGRNGATIKQICAETGAYVELSRDTPPNAYEKTFVIKGTPHQIQYAQHIIRIKLGDISPGTPLSSGSASAEYSKCRCASAAVNPGQQQALYQPQQQAIQAAQQDGGASPSIDPLTGQPTTVLIANQTEAAAATASYGNGFPGKHVIDYVYRGLAGCRDNYYEVPYFALLLDRNQQSEMYRVKRAFELV
uniref:K Homology domain-containing protein n=1 Tax=Ditylenchus dipsaci TaxID=166011 RepID=A0A915CUR8_9BILA